MGRSPCCVKEGLNRGAWTNIEDKILVDYIKVHGEGQWRNLPKKAGLKRCGKSCRLRWLNYLRPDIKRGNITNDEEELIIRLHKLLGNRWSLIAGRLSGRTDNEIKNYWKTKIEKKFQDQQNHQRSSSSSTTASAKSPTSPKSTAKSCDKTIVIKTKAFRCNKVIIRQEPQQNNNIDQENQNLDKKPIMIEPKFPSMDNIVHPTTASPGPSFLHLTDHGSSSNLSMYFEDDQLLSDFLDIDFSQLTGMTDFGNMDKVSKSTSNSHEALLVLGDLFCESQFSNVAPLVETELDWLRD